MKVIVGMSGGVDSAVSAWLLREQGFDVEGLFMTNWDGDDDAYCTNADDLQSAAAACRELGIPLHRVNFAEQYRDAVFTTFLDEYRRGRTPNPDVLCNREVKFGVFRDYARRLGAERIATGHYARLLHDGDDVRLLKGVDANKDQTYFLHAVAAAALRESMFPIGELTKSRVREIAREQGLPNFDRPDSTGICFIGERPFREFLRQYLPAQPGEMRTPQGVVVGRHEGLMFYTLGQRRGLGLGGRAEGDDAPWYVVDKDVQHNVLIVTQGESELLFSEALAASDPHWIAGDAPDGLPLHLEARVRYRQAPQRCVLAPVGADGIIRVRFEQPQRAVTPGQFVVFYRGEQCLGGATIDRALRGHDAQHERHPQMPQRQRVAAP
jgi:tRNA-specific 2-thiouridylase